VTGENLAPGGELTPNLRLRRPLGRGGMGVLWIAEHRALGTEVVVKFLSDELLGDPSAARRIAREAAAAAQVRSPHVAQVFDHGVSESGLPFIVMERHATRDAWHVVARRNDDDHRPACQGTA